MRTLLIATASALFFAYAITELTTRLWPGDYLALLILAFVALLVSGLLNLRLSSTGVATTPAAPAESAPRDRQNQGAAGHQGPARREGRAERSRSRNGNGNEPSAPKRNAAPQREAPADGPRETGTVKWFNRTKGFGFVIRDSGEEIFVHQRSIRTVGEGDERRRPGLKDGQAVNFVVAEREKGLQAEDVVPVEDV